MSDEALIHARWHRGLDDPTREEPGPNHHGTVEEVWDSGDTPEWWRVMFTAGALAKVNRARRRFRCEGHIADVEHFIEPGARYVRTSLPPDHPEINNDGWWHMRFCMACCPVEYTRPTPITATDERGQR